MTTIHVQVIDKDRGPVVVMARFESEDREGGATIGDMRQEIYPGESFWRLPFADLVALGDGAHEVDL